MKNKFYGIGVGVGDSREITVKAVEILKKLDVILLPEAKGEGGSVAYEIIKGYLQEGVEKVFMEFPMLKSLEERIVARKKNAKVVEDLLDAGKNVGFVTIGDSMTYSTYIYLLEHLDEKYQVESIAGISSFVDMAARFNFPLMMGDETLKIVPLHKGVEIEAEIATADNLVFMKISRNFAALKKAIQATGNEENIILVSNCGKETQAVSYDLANIEEVPYFSTLVLKKGGMKQWRKFTL